MTQSIFVSYVYEDRLFVDTIRQWAQSGRLGDVAVTTEQSDVRQSGHSAIRAHLRPRIEECAAMVVLLGADTHNHGWVKYELDVATSYHKNIVLVRIPSTTGAVPKGYGHLSEIPLELSALQRALS